DRPALEAALEGAGGLPPAAAGRSPADLRADRRVAGPTRRRCRSRSARRAERGERRPLAADGAPNGDHHDEVPPLNVVDVEPRAVQDHTPGPGQSLAQVPSSRQGLEQPARPRYATPSRRGRLNRCGSGATSDWRPPPARRPRAGPGPASLSPLDASEPA